MKKLSVEEMKDYIRAAGEAPAVAELVHDGWELEVALGWVYDMITLSNKEFRLKHFGF